MRFRNGKEGTGPEIASWAAAAAVIVLAALFGFYELRGRFYTNELIARNEAERTLNLLLSVARTHRSASGSRPLMPMLMQREEPNPIDEAQDFVSALESHTLLKDRILGIAAYGPDGSALFRFGTAPEMLALIPAKTALEGSPPRSYRFDARSRSLRIQHPFPVFRTRLDFPRRDRNSEREDTPGAVIFYELKETSLFNRNALAASAFAAWMLASIAAVLLVRRTVRKNAVYRETLQNQRELVALGTAARTLAHEIKNPLSAIRLQADLIARVHPGVAERELTGIAQETARIRLLVDRIGDFLREPKGNPERLRLAEFAAEVLIRAGKNGEPLPVRAERLDTTVSADAPRLRSVIENLAQNAFDSGGDSEAVEARIREEGANAVFEILDRGSGIAHDVDTERLFDPFFTTKTSGFGLGLALCRRFVEAAGGALSVSAREGGGAVARVVLPKVQA